MALIQPTTGNAPFFRVFILIESHKKPHSSPPKPTLTFRQKKRVATIIVTFITFAYPTQILLESAALPRQINESDDFMKHREKPAPPPLKGSGRKATDLPPRMRLDRMCPDPTYSQPSHADSNSPIAHRSPRNHSSGAIFIMKISLGNKVQTYTWTIHPDSILFLHRSAPYLFTNKYF